ncbi:PGF-pre-PGF domain-containing protein [Candidatus Woesearchaeota archaeon]|nr:PGF-pre-PGF domain-containing protein [Candidatus Woesearchaeota archaeon]
MPQNEICGNGIDEDCNGADKKCSSGGSSPLVMKGGSPLVMKGGWTGPKTDFLPTYPNAKHYYPEVSAPSLLTMSIDKADIPVTQLEVSVQKASQRVDMVVGVPAKPLKASELGNVYRYLIVEHENLDDSAVQGARFRFRVDNAWMQQNGFKAEDIRLYRYTDSWTELETQSQGSNSDYTMFWADAPGLSEFAIAGKKAPAPAPEPVAEPEPQVEDVQVVEEIDDSASRKITALLVVLGVLVIAVVGYLSLKTPEDEKPGKKK